MNANAQRFLAINAALNGHDFTEVFDHNLDMAVKAFNASEGKIAELQEQLQKNAQIPRLMDSCDPEIAVLVHYYRNSAYSFAHIPGFGMLSIETVAETDRNSDVEASIRNQVLMMSLRDIALAPDISKVHMADGMLQVYAKDEEQELFTQVTEQMLQAYYLYRDGPVVDNATKKHMLSIRNVITLSGYSDIGPKRALATLECLANYDGNPKDFRDTIYMIPDMLPVYRETGCIMEGGDGEVQWLLDVQDSTRCKVAIVPHTVVRSLIVNSMRDLAFIAYSDKAGELVSVSEGV